MMQTFPTLYKKTSSGAIQMWTISVDYHLGGEKGESALIQTVFGQVDGKKQIANDVVLEGKNIGKANETTAFEQAISEAKSQWERKKKKGYVESIEDAENGVVDSSMILGGVPVML